MQYQVFLQQQNITSLAHLERTELMNEQINEFLIFAQDQIKYTFSVIFCNKTEFFTFIAN